MNRLCARCNQPFGTLHSDQVYCSRQCVGAVKSDAAWRASEDPPAVQEPRRDRYDAVCMCCGRTQQEYVLTPQEARDRVRAGLPRCTTPSCGGWVALDPLFSYAVGNPPGFKPMRQEVVVA